MKTFNYIALALTALLLVTSCAIDEMWSDVEPADEQKVLTFKPKFEDFETVTKAIGDASKVDKLLVHVYEGDNLKSYEFDIRDRAVIEDVSIPFFYGKKYNVYFWAYSSSNDAYTIADGGLKNGVTVNYPESTAQLTYESLEYLDAFYAVETIDLSDDQPDNTSPSLTRPFAQVNLMANKNDLLNAQASTVIFELSAASAFVPGGDAIGGPVPRTFTFTSNDNFQTITESLDGKVYLGTTYIFVSSQEISGRVTLKDENDKTLKGPSEITIPLAKNSRTNLVFSDIQPAKLPWDDNKFVVPGDDDNDGWIHITCPEELAALLIKPSGDNITVHICDDIDMGDVDAEILNQITGKSFLGLKLDGGIYPDNNMEATPTGSNSIKNLSAAAFIGTATNLTVRNLNVDNLQISSATGHVGTLVNTLKGTSSFSNVTVSNSSATTGNGAAGGIVGYIERIAPTTRSEVMEVAFYNCKVNGAADKPVATGSLAEGKFVGLLSGYDNGETLTFDDKCSAGNNTTVADYASRYVEGNESAWQSGNNYSAYSGFLGDEKYLRAKVYFGGEDEAKNRFCPKWDGTTNTTNLDIEPLLANATYDAGTTAGTNRFVVYSAFDLAGVQKKNASPAALYLMNHVDMFGQGEDGKYNVHSNFINSANASDDDNVFKPFNSIGYLEGNNNFIYNLCLSTVGTTSYNSAFIISGGANHTHQNIKFDNCCTVVPHVVITSNGQKEDKSYGATFIQSVDGGGYIMNNVHITNSRVFAIQKTGVLAGRVLSSGGATISNCSVDNCYVENYECKDNLEKFTDSSGKVSADFYSYGEIGGLIGFVMYKATITGCSVSNTTVHAYGQDDKAASLSGYNVPVYIQGRNVNEFIGDVRCMGKFTIEITNCSVSNNTCSERNDVYTKSRKDYPIIGKAYYVGASVWLLFTTLKVGEDPGTLKVQNITNDGTKLFTSSTTVSLQSLVG